MSATIRLARPGDAAALADTMRQLFVASYAHSADAANVEQFAARSTTGRSFRPPRSPTRRSRR